MDQGWVWSGVQRGQNENMKRLFYLVWFVVYTKEFYFVGSYLSRYWYKVMVNYVYFRIYFVVECRKDERLSQKERRNGD